MANGVTANGPKTTIGFWDGLSAKSRQGGFFFLGRTGKGKLKKKAPASWLFWLGFVRLHLY